MNSRQKVVEFYINRSMDDRLRGLYERKVDPSLPDAPSFEEWKSGISKSKDSFYIEIPERDIVKEFQAIHDLGAGLTKSMKEDLHNQIDELFKGE